jgi:catechol 2,3-dioxygenase-like lactoylglutathione lyase family enzyme
VDDPQKNIHFYAQTLGLRLVKQTVNFDDPGSYHLYFGDALGRPGTILTFFPLPGLRRASNGSGQVSATALAIPEQSVSYWSKYCSYHDIHVDTPFERFGQQVIPFYDPAGLLLELVVQPGAETREGWSGGVVASEHAIRGVAGVTLTLQQSEPTAAFLTNVLGFRHTATEDNRFRYLAGDDSTFVDLVSRPDIPYGTPGTGVVHHVAWSTADDAQQQTWRNTLFQHGINVTPVRDRQYFRSIYFHEPGGVLFEIATDHPGFTLDEAPEQLGTHLQLPPWLEQQRPRIERLLPPLELPDVA